MSKSGPNWSEEMFRVLTQHSVDIISLLDAQGHLLYNSPATERINGFTAEDLQGRDTFELIHPDDRAAVTRMYAEVLSAPGAVQRVEYRYLTKDGRWLWMEAVASNQLDNPAVRGVVANSRDISARKQAEAEHRALEQQLLHAQKLESLGVLAGGVAHDFNNLLAVILGEVSALQLGASTPAEALANIENAARRGADLAQQLLTWAGRREPNVEATDLARLVAELEPLLRLSARGEVELRLDVERGLPAVMCDQGQIRQVLLNLVINGSEAVAGPGIVSVRLSRRNVTRDELGRGPLTASFAPGPAVVLEVQDTGRGMPAATLERIFEPFFTTKETGRGLGLSAVTGIVRAHGAGLTVQSEPGAGSRFALYFRPTDASAAAKQAMRARFSGRVLVVDDEAVVARTTARLLGVLGFDAEVASGGAEAVQRFAAEPSAFALVLSDVLMPGVSGPDAAAKMRALRSDLPVLFVSGYAPEPGLLTAGPRTAFVEKPFDASTLVAALRRLVPEAERREPAPAR